MNFKKIKSNHKKFVLIKEKENKSFELTILFEIFQNNEIFEKIFSDEIIFSDKNSISVIKDIISCNTKTVEEKTSETNSDYFYKFDFNEFIILLIDFQHKMLWKAYIWIKKSCIKISAAITQIKYTIESTANYIENKL